MTEELVRFEKTVHRQHESTTVTRRVVVDKQSDGVDVRVEEEEEDGYGWRTVRRWAIDEHGATPSFPEASQA